MPLILSKLIYLETVAADSLVTGARIKAVVQRRSCRHQQAGHLRAVALKHSHTLMTLKEREGRQLQLSVDAPAENQGTKKHHPPPGQRL